MYRLGQSKIYNLLSKQQRAIRSLRGQVACLKLYLAKVSWIYTFSQSSCNQAADSVLQFKMRV